MDPEKLNELNELEAMRNSEASPKVKKIQQILHYDGVNITREQIEKVEATALEGDDNPQAQPDWAIMCKLYNAYEWVVWSLKNKFYAADHNDNTQTTDDITQVGEAPIVTDTIQEST